jgi:CNT family concentrative nucleoside transporter
MKLVSLAGLVLLLTLAWVLSVDRKRFPWATVVWGLVLQFVFAVVILKTQIGLAFFDFAQRGFDRLNQAAMTGARMVFGPLADPTAMAKGFGPENVFVFAVTISATIIVVSALSTLLYHWQILPRLVEAMARLMRRIMRTSGSETLAAVANIFLGQTEAPLLIRPYVAGMTQSELLAVMIGGMASIAGGVLAVYVSLGASGGHLITASVMSAPASLLVAKILWPETALSETAAETRLKLDRKSVNSIDALCEGASEGMALSLNVVAMLVAFVAVVELLNYTFGLLQRPFATQFTLQQVLGWANAPFAFLMGIPAKDSLLVGQLLGERIVLNEFIAYLGLTAQKEALDPRSFTLASYALCGFANFGSVAIQIGGIGVMAPSRRGDLARLGIRAMIGGLLSCYLTATIVGILI